MLLLTGEEMQQADKLAVELGIPEILLMETAGRATAAQLLEFANPKPKEEIIILAGSGNNGGDGLVAARYLKRWGYQVTLLLLKSPDNFTGITADNYRFCQLAEVKTLEMEELSETEINHYLKGADYFVDALLGTGITGAARGLAGRVISLINNNPQPTLAVDIPSGLQADSGEIPGPVVKAHWTVTMANLKLGQVLYPGRSYCGEIQLVDLGFPPQIYKKLAVSHYMLTDEEVAKLIPARSTTGHKGDFGRVLVVAGSQGMSGAALLTAMAALKGGAGLVELAAPAAVVRAAAAATPEIITRELPAREGKIAEDSLTAILKAAKEAEVIALGPGLGQNQQLKRLLSKLLTKLDKPLVLDADGLNNLTSLESLRDFDQELIITPHPGEMARLSDGQITDITANRKEIAKDFAQKEELVLLLKGADSLIALPQGELFINPTGTEAMATAGSGDVLTGLIAALMAQGLAEDLAATIGAYLHGRAGELAAEDLSSYAVTAGDILNYLPGAFKSLKKKTNFPGGKANENS